MYAPAKKTIFSQNKTTFLGRKTILSQIRPAFFYTNRPLMAALIIVGATPLRRYTVSFTFPHYPLSRQK